MVLLLWRAHRNGFPHQEKLGSRGSELDQVIAHVQSGFRARVGQVSQLITIHLYLLRRVFQLRCTHSRQTLLTIEGDELHRQ